MSKAELYFSIIIANSKFKEGTIHTMQSVVPTQPF